MRTKAVCRRWPNVGSPRFRRDPFVRDGVFDLGRASAPRIAVPHMLPSATLKASASAILLLSRLNRPPRTIAVYASPWSSPPTTQHSLPGGRYPLPGPDIHRLDLASFLAHSCLSLKFGYGVESRHSRAPAHGRRLAHSALPRERFSPMTLTGHRGGISARHVMETEAAHSRRASRVLPPSSGA